MQNHRTGKVSGDVRTLYREARKLLFENEFTKAERVAKKIVGVIPDQSVAWSLLAEVETKLHKYNKALKTVTKAVRLDPENASRLVQQARNYLMVGRIDDARRVSVKALNLEIDQAEIWMTLSSVLSNCLEHEHALTATEKALERDPDNSTYLHNKATSLRFLGHLAEAEAVCDKVISRNADDYEIIGLRSSLRKQSETSNHVEELKERLFTGIKTTKGGVHVCYALAKELEDLGHYAESFQFLEQGAGLKRRSIKYDPQQDRELFEALIKVFNADVFSRPAGGHDCQEPIFVLGLPRTGSTLVERILSSHSKVDTAGELQQFGAELSRLIKERRGDNQIRSKEEFIEASIGVDYGKLGRSYIETTRPFSGGKVHFIDKLPLNCLHIGLIHLAMPKAKIIHVTRGSMDTCYAIYKNLFNKAYPFSYDLLEIGRYYIGYYRMMEHWRDMLPGKILDISYEELVTNQETQSRRLLSHCDLDWEADVLDFHKSAHASMTASAAQVRQPIYSSSVAKWRRYEKELLPLAGLLEKEGIPLDPEGGVT